jgi:hypothetical protein
MIQIDDKLYAQNLDDRLSAIDKHNYLIYYIVSIEKLYESRKTGIRKIYYRIKLSKEPYIDLVNNTGRSHIESIEVETLEEELIILNLNRTLTKNKEELREGIIRIFKAELEYKKTKFEEEKNTIKSLEKILKDDLLCN